MNIKSLKQIEIIKIKNYIDHLKYIPINILDKYKNKWMNINNIFMFIIDIININIDNRGKYHHSQPLCSYNVSYEILYESINNNDIINVIVTDIIHNVKSIIGLIKNMKKTMVSFKYKDNFNIKINDIIQLKITSLHIIDDKILITGITSDCNYM